jgi:hypothetical protein
MKESNHRKVVGIYDRPARADRRWPRRLVWVLIVLVAIAWAIVLLNRS